MAMRARVLRDFAGERGAIVYAGTVVGFDDDAKAYALIHDGLVEAPIRLRAAIGCLVGSRNVEAGDLVDLPPEMGPEAASDRRFEPLAAVVAGEPSGRGLDGALNWSAPAGSLAAVPPALAVQLVAAGGRYATKEEAAGLDLGGRDRFAKPGPAGPKGPTTKLYFLAGGMLPDGRTIPNDAIVDVADEYVERLLGIAGVRRCVEARVLRDGVIVEGRVCSAGDVVQVPASIADDGDRFASIAGPGGGRPGKAVDVLAMAGGGPGEADERPAKAAGKRTVAAGDAR